MDVVRLHQAGVHYAVATLGTATTAEHLKRVFQLVSEVVFSFDGDRAGRAAAWRALQNALPEARRGARAALPVPARGRGPGHPGGQGRPRGLRARACRAGGAAVGILRARAVAAERACACGRAGKFAENARPLLLKVPDGVYRELLPDRLAEVVGLKPERLRQLWTPEAAAAADESPPWSAHARASRPALDAGASCARPSCACCTTPRSQLPSPLRSVPDLRATTNPASGCYGSS